DGYPRRAMPPPADGRSLCAHNPEGRAARMGLHVMRAVPEPAAGTRRLLVPTNAPAISGEGAESYRCARCPTTLLRAVSPGEVVDIVVGCPYCGMFNQVRST